MDSTLNATWLGEHRSGVTSAMDREAMLTGQSLMQLSERSTIRVGGIICLDFAIITAAIVTSEWLRAPWAYVIAVLLIGARQIGIASIALHDGVHGLILRNRKYNDLLAKILSCAVFVLLLADFSDYRKSHIEHHRHTNTKHDPDFPFVRNLYLGASPRKIALVLLLQLSGIGFVQALINFARQGSWRRRLWIAGAVLALTTGAVLSLYPVNLFLLYWVVPFATWGLFINLVRAISEHYPPGFFRAHQAVAGILFTRDVLPSWFDSLFVATRGVNYHFTHHLFPSVPFYRLKTLHRRISRTEPYRSTAHVTQGYHRALAEILRRR